MINGIIAGIIAAIKAEFGDGYKIYDELPTQGLKEPCFYVKCVAPTTVRGVGRRLTRAYTFNITYFPKNAANPMTECLNAEERLSVALQDIVAAGIAVHANAEISGSFVDGNLQANAVYSVPALLAETLEESMEILEQTTVAE